MEKSGRMEKSGSRRCQLVADAVKYENQETLALTSILSQDGRGGFRKFYLRDKDGRKERKAVHPDFRLL
jgi:hypothetical protein